MIERRMADDGQLQSKVVGGLSYSLLNTTVGRVGTFITGLLLARLLSPEDYGLFAIAQVVLLALLELQRVGREPCAGEVGRGSTSDRADGCDDERGLEPRAGCGVLRPGAGPRLLLRGARGNLDDPVLSTCVVADAVTAIPAAVMSRECHAGAESCP